ncbi:hypothetical protein MKW92_015605 [Papaver armeniacum]|nr:hypothetical protein MKW92_015605 [Papaver armeniacum]
MSGGMLRRIVSPLYSSRHLLGRSQIPKSNPNFQLHPLSSTQSSSNLRFFCSSEDTNKEDPIFSPELKFLFPGIKYYANKGTGNKKMIRVILNAILARKLSGKHADGTDKEIFKEIGKELKDQENYPNGKEFYYCPLRGRIIIEVISVSTVFCSLSIEFSESIKLAFLYFCI